MQSDTAANLRRTVYLIVGTVAVAIALARVTGAENVWEPSRFAPQAPGAYGSARGEDAPVRKWPPLRPEPTPTFSSNDKSRWATIRALVDHGTYVVGNRADFKNPKYIPENDSGIIFEDDYKSLDKVMNPETGEYFSSKPPLFTTVLAGEYWVLKKLFGWEIVQDRWLVLPTIVATVNVLPFAIYLLLLSKLIEYYGKTDFGKLMAFTTAAVGTFILSFSITLNNHTPAAYFCLFAIYPLIKPRLVGEVESIKDLILSGFFAACTAAMDLPAACLTASLIILVLWVRRAKGLWMLAGVLPVVVVFFATNYAALGRLMPAYGEFGGPWYEFPGSHWARLRLAQQGIPQKGIDFAQETRTVYLFHCVLGHHGWFSLTPVWFLGLVGMARSAKQATQQLFRSRQGEAAWTLPLIAGLTLVLTMTLIVFFVYVQKTNNYGGNTSGLRWLFWLTPLWLLTSLVGLDSVAHHRFGRAMAIFFLGLSVFAVFYPVWNPWRSPWLLQLLDTLGWVRYG